MADLEVYQKDHKIFRVQANDSAGDAKDISSWTAFTAVFRYRGNDSGTPVISKTFPSGGIAFETDGTDGKLLVTLEETDTIVDPGELVFAVRGLDDSTEPKTVGTYTLEVLENVTD